MDPHGDYVFRLRTVKAAPFRTLIEAMKEILTEANIEIDAGGLKVLSTDGTHTVLVHLRLHHDRFDEFKCAHRQVIGVNMINLFKLVKTMSNNDSLVLFMERAEPTKLGILILNGEKQMTTQFFLNLIDLRVQPIEVPPVTFASIITMPSLDFQKIVRDMATLGETVEILSASNELILRCRGDFAEQETVFTVGQNGVTMASQHDIVQGEYLLKHLALFTKCSSLCTDIQLYLRNSYPIIVEFNVAGLGEIKLALAPSPSKAAAAAAAAAPAAAGGAGTGAGAAR
jgi:proliferating cell nuclear antigen